MWDKTLMKKIITLAIIVGFLVTGIWLVKSSMVNPQVAQIEAMPVDSCISNILSFSTTETCAPGKVKRVDYVCNDQSKVGYEGGGPNDCIDPLVVFEHASSYCGKSCSAELLSPRPSSPSTPYPSPSVVKVEGPTFSCMVRVFKLKSTDVTGAPMQFATRDRELGTGSINVSPGDRLAYLVESKANSFATSVSTILVSTDNEFGFDEPISIKAVSPSCKVGDSQSKYLTCTHEQVVPLDSTSKLLDLGMVVEVQKSIQQTNYTNVKFHVNYLLQGAYVPADCNVVLYNAPVVTETPFTPSPSFTPTATTTTSCAKQLGSWSYRVSCGTDSYRYLDFKCQGDEISRTIGGTSSCKSTSTWLSEAKKACLNTACPTSTPVPTLTPNIAPVRRGCYSVFGRRICMPEFRPRI